MYYLLGTAILLALIFIIVRVKYGHIAGLVTKIIASLGFVMLAVFTIDDYNYEIAPFILAGLIMGLVGDILLDLRAIYRKHKDIYYVLGVISFSLGHIFYLMALIFIAFNYDPNNIDDFFFTETIYLCIAIGQIAMMVIYTLSRLLKMNFGKHLWISLFYCMLLTAVTIFSVFVVMKFSLLFYFAFGMIFFLVSDIILSIQYFGGLEKDNVMTILNHLLYYGSQIMIALSLYDYTLYVH